MIDDFDIDPTAARAGRGIRHLRFNTVELPAMRALGFTLIVGASALHNGLITLVVSPRVSVGVFAVVAATYCLLSCLALRRWYRENARVQLGLLFLFVVVAMMALALVSGDIRAPGRGPAERLHSTAGCATTGALKSAMTLNPRDADHRRDALR